MGLHFQQCLEVRFVVSRAAWARAILEAAGVNVTVTEVPLSSWTRPSAVPPWAAYLLRGAP